MFSPFSSDRVPPDSHYAILNLSSAALASCATDCPFCSRHRIALSHQVCKAGLHKLPGTGECVPCDAHGGIDEGLAVPLVLLVLALLGLRRLHRVGFQSTLKVLFGHFQVFPCPPNLVHTLHRDLVGMWGPVVSCGVMWCHVLSCGATHIGKRRYETVNLGTQQYTAINTSAQRYTTQLYTAVHSGTHTGTQQHMWCDGMA